MQADQIDRLAAFCGLAEKGYLRICDNDTGEFMEWEYDRDPERGRVWRPDESDDDCRVVLEECRRLGLLGRVSRALRGMLWLAVQQHHHCDLEDIQPMDFVLASPREKCEAVAKVCEL